MHKKNVAENEKLSLNSNVECFFPFKPNKHAQLVENVNLVMSLT